MGRVLIGLGLTLVLVSGGCSDGTSTAPADGGQPADGAGDDSGVPDGPPPTNCAGRTLQPADADWTLTFAGVPRKLRVHVPPSYDPRVPMPLVLNFHAKDSDPLEQEQLSLLPGKADAAGFIAIHPEGVAMSWNAGTCCEPASTTNVDDVGFVRALLDEAEAKLCVDSRRIFATGFDNGASLAHRLGCELTDRIAAIASVAGVNLMAVCAPARPISVIYFHGTSDTLAPYDGSATSPAVRGNFTEWAGRDGCTGQTVTTFANGDSVCGTYETCAAGVAVTLCVVDDGGHTWPGGLPLPHYGKTTTDLSATDAMWDFFQQHPLP